MVPPGGSLGWTAGRNSSQKEGMDIGKGCPGWVGVLLLRGDLGHGLQVQPLVMGWTCRPLWAPPSPGYSTIPFSHSIPVKRGRQIPAWLFRIPKFCSWPAPEGSLEPPVLLWLPDAQKSPESSQGSRAQKTPPPPGPLQPKKRFYQPACPVIQSQPCPGLQLRELCKEKSFRKEKLCYWGKIPAQNLVWHWGGSH